MFRKIAKDLFLFVVSLTLILPTPALAGEPMEVGTVLTEDSYVFTLDEAKDLLKRMEELEKKEELLTQYQELVDVKDQKIGLLEDQLQIKGEMLQERERLLAAADKRIQDLERYTRLRPLEDAGFTLLGIGLAVGLMFAVDAVEDRVEFTGSNAALQQRVSGQNFEVRAQLFKVQF